MGLKNIKRLSWKGFFILTAFVVFAIIFNLGNVEAAEGFTCADSQMILRLSSSTNAHGATWNGTGNYPVQVCYDKIFGVPYNTTRYPNFRECFDNKVVGLSSTTNAHAEYPNQTTYNTNICYGDLKCTTTTGSCPGGGRVILSLSSNTNAHLANSSISGYTNICCTSSGVGPGKCEFTNSFWSDSPTSGTSISEANKSDTVYMRVVGSDACNGKPVDFKIGEVDSGNNYANRDVSDTALLNVNSASATFQNGVAASWVAEWHKDTGFLTDDDPEYVFKAELRENPGVVNIDDSGQLKVKIPPVIIDNRTNVTWCKDYTTQPTCDAFDPAVAARTVQAINPSINCDASDTDCFCYWNASLTDDRCNGGWDVDNITIEPPTPIGTCRYTQQTTDNCDDGFLTFSWTANWQWDSSCDAACQATNQNKASQCQPGQRTVECPAQIALPFFNFYNIIVAIVVIALIYWAMHLRKKGKRRRK